MQRFSDNSNISLCVDSNNCEHPSPENPNGLNASPDLTETWPVNWTDSSSVQTSWDYDQHTFEDSGLRSTPLIEDSAENCLEFNLSPTTGSVSNLSVLPSDLINFLSTSSIKTDPWNHFNKHDLTLGYFPTTLQQRLELATPIAYSQFYTHTSPNASSKGIQGDPYFDHGEKTLRSSNSSLGASAKTTAAATTSQKPINAIDCTWPSCNKSFSTRAAYK
ncbi:hypothetical protein IFR05_003873 [Cadophora sp. M221]|nr:hypothetical protein IFR05_003873 [Cadophora sp. M221]